MKEHERATIEKAEKLTAELEKSPLLRKLREDEAAQNLTIRLAAAEKIATLTRELETHGAIQAEIDGMIEKLADMDRERRELLEKIGAKRYDFAKERGGIEGEIRREEQTLLTCYDPQIDEAITFFREKLDFLRSPGRISRIAGGSERNVFTETKITQEETNEPAVLAALAYCMDAIKTVEKMKLTPALDVQKIEELKASIPSVEVYSEVSGEKPLPKGPDPSFLKKTWDAVDARIAQLLT